MTTKKPLTPQERARTFEEEYQKLCKSYSCQLVAFPAITAEGRVVAQIQVKVNDVPA